MQMAITKVVETIVARRKIKKRLKVPFVTAVSFPIDAAVFAVISLLDMRKRQCKFQQVR